MSLSTGQLTFGDIFNEFYTLYRAQGSDIPVFGDREYTTGIHLGNNAIKKWERADGIEWRELQNTLQNGDGGTISSGTTEYDAPSDMRKPPAFIRLGSSFVPVIDPQEVKLHTDTSYAYFLGGASSNFTMVIPDGLSSTYDGQDIDYLYQQKATLLRTDVTPAATVPQMSDPNFMIQDMLAARFLQSRNGMGYNVAREEADRALANMKVQNNTGTFAHPSVMPSTSAGWGAPKRDSIFN